MISLERLEMEPKKYFSILTIPEIDNASFTEARKLFFAFKDKRVITYGLFDEHLWGLTDEYANYSFNFNFRKRNLKNMDTF
jgi:hypothetical protein